MFIVSNLDISSLGISATVSVVCTAHQRDGIRWLVDQMHQGTPLTSLQGLAGTGKTTVIAPLFSTLTVHGFSAVLAAPTHRAAEVLRRKGAEDVATVHQRALTAQFTIEYTEARAWLGPAEAEEGESHRGEGPIPALLEEQRDALDDPRDDDDLLDDAEEYGAEAVLDSLGIRGRDHIIGFTPKPMRSTEILVVDEGSMVGREMLALCQQVFRRIILVGDPGQLPPVNDTPMLFHAPAFVLTEIHRQAQGSPLILLAHQARQGYPFWRRGLERYAPAAQQITQAPATAFLHAPLLVWRNNTRIACTRAIRAALGYPPEQLVVGEPLICRATTRAFRVDGFYNNAQFHIAAITGARSVVLREALTGRWRHAEVHLEELDGPQIPVGYIPFRFGYALTCHTAQGGEWPTVYVLRSELQALSGYAWHTQREELVRQWAYTSITRAQEALRLLDSPAFTSV